MRTGPLRKRLLLNVECRHQSLSSRLLSSPQQILSFSSPPSSLLLFSMYTFSFCFSSPTLNFPPPSSAVIWLRSAFDWQLRELWWILSNNPPLVFVIVMKDRKKDGGEPSFSLVQFLVTRSRGTTRFLSFLSAPSPIISVFCYPDRSLPGEAARERDWRGAKQILHLHVSRTLLRC